MDRRIPLTTFNRGVISRLALARTDVDRVNLSAETQRNWMPRTLGSMMLRPGLEYITGTKDDAQSRSIPFVFSSSDYAALEFTPGAMRVLKSGTDVLTRAAGFSTTLTNGEFTTDLSGWSDEDETGATSAWASGGYMNLTGTGYDAAIREQEITVASADRSKVHSLKIVVERGPVLFRIGKFSGRDDVFTQAVLRTGTHSLAFTPDNASVFVQFLNTRKTPALVSECTLEAAGTVELPTPWTTTTAVDSMRWQQVNDVVFCAADGYRQRRIERRANDSWSVVEYAPDDGPFETENVENIRLTPSAQTGEITLTASQKIFASSDVGALYRISSVGQRVESALSSAATWTNSVRVTGVGETRPFTIGISGTWSGTVSLQRSIGEEGAWATVATYTGNTSTTYDDELDNSIVFYRIGFDTGDYTSGTANLSLTYSTGSITGVVKVTGYSSATTVDAVVLSDLGGTDASEIWAKGSWSDTAGWPTAVAISGGRLWWAGRGRAWGSVSDAYESFDPDFEGDAGPINRTIGARAVDRVNWLLPLQRLLAGTDDAERSIRSSSLEEPVTPSNYNVREVATLGSAQIPAIQVDRKGVFVERSRVRLYELEYDLNGYDYAATDLTTLVPEIAAGGFTRIAVQRQPDTRIHCVKSNGTVAILVRDKAEDILCWVGFLTDGSVEDVFVLPGDEEDRVFYTVARTIGGATKRYHERWALEQQARGGNLCRCADSYIVVNSIGSRTITGLGHLEDKTVVVWADGKDKGTAQVIGGSITLDEAVDDAVIGLAYTARYESAKLALNTREFGSTLSFHSRVRGLQLILADTHYQGLRFGPSFTTMDPLPLYENAETTAADTVWEAYAEDTVTFPGEWGTDSRICLEASAPRPCTVLAAMADVAWQR